MTEELKQQVLDEIKQYLRENIEDFDKDADRALDKIDKWRAPLHIIDGVLYNEIQNKMEEWLTDNFEPEDFIW